MRILLSFVAFVCLIQQSTARDGSATTSTGVGSSQTPSTSLRELLNAYQSLYEQQFREPLPENQKALLAALPRFNSLSTLKAQRAADLSKSFQQDGDPKKLQQKEATTATAQLQKREIAATSESPEEFTTTTTSSTQSTVDGSSEITNFITETSPLTVTGTSEGKTEHSFTSAPTTPTTITATSPTSPTVRALTPQVQMHKLTELHPEMKPIMDGKVKPAIVKELKASSKGLELPVKVIPTQIQENPVQSSRITSLKPMTVISRKESSPVVMPNPEVITTKTQDPGADLSVQSRANSTSSAPHQLGNMVPTTMRTDMRREMKPKGLVIKVNKPDFQMKPRKMEPLRKPEAVRKNVVAAKPRGMKPVPRLAQRQPSNLKVLNHVVVPRTQAIQARGLKKQHIDRTKNLQIRRPQTLRRASAPRPVPSAAVDGNSQAKMAPRTNSLIVIRDGRIMDLTEQQQKDLNMILSAMGAATKETSTRRRAPVRRNRPIPARRQIRQRMQK